ncbi:50S ribosomal protein L16, partial [Candidatus Micrarchaeota archaeon]|nr:50S ribosomal protein L16 [Candidatus Micrarchaeota archaeon]
MGLRPARTSRELKGQPWTRLSIRRPRKSYVKGVPHNKVRQFIMGTDKPYEVEVVLELQSPIQIRDNSLESARQACNKVLEKNLLANYFMQVTKYPHFVLRESASLGVAGADRISKGMKRAFGKPKGRLVRVKEGEVIFKVRGMKKNIAVIKKALERAKIK